MNRWLLYFYDRNTGELFAAPDELNGPIEAPSGSFQGQPAGVRAHVFTCGSCYVEEDRFVGWLEIPASALGVEPSAANADPTGEAVEVSEDGQEIETLMICRPDDQKWVNMASGEADMIMEAIGDRCSDVSKLRYCRPRPRPWPP